MVNTDYKKSDLIYKLINKNPQYNSIYLTNKNLIIGENQKVLPNNGSDFSSVSQLKTFEKLFEKLGKIDGELVNRGGIETYQIASMDGQDSKRGGDSSKRLIKWVNEFTSEDSKIDNLNSVLEIGSLSTKNEISRKYQKIYRIDLNPQNPNIHKQDFMKMEIPKKGKDKFDLISLSLVLNFMLSSTDRGEMLKRICYFLKNPLEGHMEEKGEKSGLNSIYPSLFLVLPLPCIKNSRYLNLQLLTEKVMKPLNFSIIKQHESNKLFYSLWKWHGLKKDTDIINIKYKKQTIQEGSNRNNFSISF
ncbi:25S rRNA (adenine2142-N1)-methyltransferase ASCRUDRAFT_77961 [Ascoidea rubescens DSM 1968]|uniref:25S rRNA adenine-N(1) methyltransferase n=1 Tax=Ascoidea rubescens DSM 1968 TaxID=1344418 RepID=A0A1D2V9P2_9ASCO|nr:hypothetical protein ASCRUDRAFT_77961 [Ascoidea rubescens DSM 1968]ODV58255.1 hypothetical protein ASCRUDRAFT_77961 [Ascoidea rubescens DSM 1968]